MVAPSASAVPGVTSSAALPEPAAFRLREPALYPRHYGFEHGHPDLLDRAVYGLPELAGDALREASLVACPGCYPTSVILPLRPLVDGGIIDVTRPVIVDSASGVTNRPTAS